MLMLARAMTSPLRRSGYADAWSSSPRPNASGYAVDPTGSGSPVAHHRDVEPIMTRSLPITEDVTPIEQSLAEACAVYGAAEIEPRGGAAWPAQLLAAAGTIAVLLVLLSLMDDVKGWATQRVEVLFVLGGLGMWRWGWCLFQCARA